MIPQQNSQTQGSPTLPHVGLSQLFAQHLPQIMAYFSQGQDAGNGGDPNAPPPGGAGFGNSLGADAGNNIGSITPSQGVAKPSGMKEQTSTTVQPQQGSSPNIASAIGQAVLGASTGNVAAPMNAASTILEGSKGQAGTVQGGGTTSTGQSSAGGGQSSSGSGGSSSQVSAPQAPSISPASQVGTSPTPTPQNSQDPLGESKAGPPIGKQALNTQAHPGQSMADIAHSIFQGKPQEYQAVANLFNLMSQNQGQVPT